MKTTLTQFQRAFRRAREAADQGDTVVIASGSSTYVFERRDMKSESPFAGLEGVFGAVSLAQGSKSTLREKVRSRLASKNRHRGRRAA